MILTNDTIIQYSYFFIFVFSVIVLLDVLIRFKSPIKLKIFFLLFVLSILVGSFCSFISSGTDQYTLILMICPMLVGTSMVQMFTNLYFIQHKKIANVYTIFAYAVYIYLIFYVQIMGYDRVFPKSNGINSLAAQGGNSISLPIYIDLFLELDFFLFLSFCLYYIYNILFKFSFKNIYFKKIQYWTFCFFMIIFIQLVLFLLNTFLKVPNYFEGFLIIFSGLFLLLIILYRPSFINKNGSKISLGFLFNKKDFVADISGIDFNFHFFTNFYYKSKTANIVEFSNIMGISKEVMFSYVYFTYSMSFDELINKARIDYFVEMVKESKYKNYTVESLALKVGFTSRQRFYQPFKKYHGGNPSDLIDVLND